jgi:hypothetical protein
MGVRSKEIAYMSDNTVSKFDRIRGSLDGIALFTKPTTVQNIETVTGKGETFIVETARHAELGDTIFIQSIDENQQVTRLALPPTVANAIQRQRDALTSRSRSRASKTVAQARKDRGELPGFMKNRKKK